jgi:hypothetical protein
MENTVPGKENRPVPFGGVIDSSPLEVLVDDAMFEDDGSF